MRFPDTITIGQKYAPAMGITDKAEADAYFEACVEHTIRVAGYARSCAEQVERLNLGYYAGYFDEARRWRSVCRHRAENRMSATEQPLNAHARDQAFAAGVAQANDLVVTRHE